MRLSITYEMHFNFAGMGHGDKYEDSSLDVFQYFNSSCYCGYSDDDQVVTSFTSLLYLFSLSQNLKWSLISLILTMYPLKLKTQQNNNHTLVCNKEMKPTYIFSVFLSFKQTDQLTYICYLNRISGFLCCVQGGVRASCGGRLWVPGWQGERPGNSEIWEKWQSIWDGAYCHHIFI